MVRPAGSSVSHGAGYGEPNGGLGRPGAGAWLGPARQNVGVMVVLWWIESGYRPIVGLDGGFKRLQHVQMTFHLENLSGPNPLPKDRYDCVQGETIKIFLPEGSRKVYFYEAQQLSGI